MNLKIWIIYLDGFAFIGSLTPEDALAQIEAHSAHTGYDKNRYSVSTILVENPLPTPESTKALAEIYKMDAVSTILDKRREAVKYVSLPK